MAAGINKAVANPLCGSLSPNSQKNMSSTGIESSGLNLWIRERRFEKRMRLANEKYDAFVISIPKSGRTWHRLMLGYYLTRTLASNPEHSLKLEDLCERSGIPLIAYSHNGTSFSDKLPPRSRVVASPEEWKNKKVMLLVRDNRDVLVSAYFHCRYREKSFDGSVSQYIRHPFVGIEKLLTALNRWHQTKHLAKSFEVLTYEEMRANPIAALRKTLLFAGVQNPVEAHLNDAVEFTRIENLQKLEKSNFFGEIEMQNRSNDPRARKVREGKIGGFREHLSQDDLDFIAEKEAELTNPFSQIPVKSRYAENA